MDGCEEAIADWQGGRASARYDPDKTSPQALVKAVNDGTPFEASLLER